MGLIGVLAVKRGIDFCIDRATPQESGVSTKIQVTMNKRRCMTFESQEWGAR
jgi:hypothetical protein